VIFQVVETFFKLGGLLIYDISFPTSLCLSCELPSVSSNSSDDVDDDDTKVSLLNCGVDIVWKKTPFGGVDSINEDEEVELSNLNGEINIGFGRELFLGIIDKDVIFDPITFIGGLVANGFWFVAFEGDGDGRIIGNFGVEGVFVNIFADVFEGDGNDDGKLDFGEIAIGLLKDDGDIFVGDVLFGSFFVSFLISFV